MPDTCPGWTKSSPSATSYPGVLDWQIVRPVAGITATYTIILRFDTRAHLENWMNSSDRRRLVDKVRPLLVTGDDFFVRSGLDFWFTPEAKARVPVRWKQFLVTWSAIFPLVSLLPIVLVPLLHKTGLPRNHFLDTFCVTGVIVALMVYVIMPRYTKLISRWLFN